MNLIKNKKMHFYMDKLRTKTVKEIKCKKLIKLMNVMAKRNPKITAFLWLE